MLIDTIAFIVFLWLKPRIEHRVQYLENKLKPNPKGTVFYQSEDEEKLEDFINNLPKE